MRNIYVFAAVIAAGLALTAWAEPVRLSDAGVEKMSESMVGAVVDSYNTGNYAKMAVNFSENMLKDFTQKKFEGLRDENLKLYGQIKSVKYLGCINQLDYTMVLYKAVADKAEMLIKMTVSDDGGKVSVIGLWMT